MRITFNMQATSYHKSISDSLSTMMNSADRVNNKRSLLSPEQSPTAYVSAYGVQRMIDEITQFSKNAGNANTWLTNANDELTAAVKYLTSAKNDLAVGGASSDKDANDRKAMAGDVKGIYDALLNIANANYMGSYIFGGYSTNTPPFTSTSNSVSGVLSLTQNGGDVNAKPVFEDLPELASGKYQAVVSVENGIGKLQILDSKGIPVILDSNGSDEAGGQGNQTSTTLTFQYSPGGVVNTGRGISVKMPISTNQNFSMALSATYAAGSEMGYQGDDGTIFSKVGYNQDVGINVPGSSIFMQTYKTIQGSRFSTVNGLPATNATYFSQLDKTNSSLGDSITIKGTNYNGMTIGSALVSSPTDPKLDLSKASEKERTLTVTYGNNLYKIVVPQAAYKTSDDLANAINFQLQNAEFVGAIGNLPPNLNADNYASFIQAQVNSGKYQGESTPAARKNYLTDLSKDIKVTTDGGRIQFGTSKAGDNVILAITGQSQNALGFNGRTVASRGEDISFELGYEFHSDTIKNIGTSYTKDLKQPNGGSYNVFVNGKLVTVKMPPITTVAAASINQDIRSGNDYVFSVKGKQIIVKASEIAAAATDVDLENLLNSKISAMGLGPEAHISGLAAAGAGGTYNYNTETTDQSAKELEMAFSKALQNAGFGLGVSVSFKEGTPTPPATYAGVGTFDISFNIVNNNIDKNTQLTTVFYNLTDPANPVADEKTSEIVRTDSAFVKPKTVGDYLKFVENLYGGSVDASLDDSGRLVIKDLRSGQSKMSIDIRPQNTGISYANDNLTNVGGKYTGTKNDQWTVSLTQTLNANGMRDINIVIKDKVGNKIYDQVTNNYLGGGIQLPYGVTINPYAMNDLVAGIFPTKTIAFNLDLTANPNLGFGDMNTIESGKNVNVFRSLENLMHALEYNITKNGVSEPTAWRSTDLKSTAKPYFDGVFQGAFNDNWSYTVLQNNGKTDFYVQNEYKSSTGAIKYNPAYAAASTLEFGVDYYDNTTGKQERMPVTLDLSLANPPITSDKEMQDYITKTLNNDSRFVDKGISFSANGSQIQISSGAGTKIANFVLSGDGVSRNITSSVMGFNVTENSTVAYPVTLNATNNTIFVGGEAITLTARAYANSADLLMEINAQLAASGHGVTAEIGTKNELIFKSGSTILEANAGGASNPLGLAMYSTTGGVDIFSQGLQKPVTDLSEAKDEARSLSFTYVTGGVPSVTNKISVTLDKKAYTDLDEMVKDINAKLNAQFAGGASPIKASITSGGTIQFTNSDPNMSDFMVEGDYAGTLGFPKAGDEVKVSVASEKGGIVQELVINSGNKSVPVADGVLLGFDSGSIFATDSFSAAVGSGIEREIGVLDIAEKQVLSALSLVGNRGSRIDTTISFQKTIITASEKTRAGYLGATEVDQAEAITDYNLASSAYESALSVVGKIMSISLLDFLR